MNKEKLKYAEFKKKYKIEINENKEEELINQFLGKDQLELNMTGQTKDDIQMTSILGLTKPNETQITETRHDTAKTEAHLLPLTENQINSLTPEQKRAYKE